MTPDAPAPILEFEGVTKTFGGIHALENVSLAIPRGEVHALVGENGAGKSTLIRICGGVLHPDAGRIPLRRRGGGLPQHAGVADGRDQHRPPGNPGLR